MRPLSLHFRPRPHVYFESLTTAIIPEGHTCIVVADGNLLASHGNMDVAKEHAYRLSHDRKRVDVAKLTDYAEGFGWLVVHVFNHGRHISGAKAHAMVRAAKAA